MNKINENMQKIVEFLNDGQYHDGTTLGEKLNITRAAVWKIIKKLQDYNIPIQSVQGKGYFLNEPLILLHPKKIKAHLKKKKAHIDVFEKIDSTNDHLKKISPCNHPIICITETQTLGRGRFNRTWHSPFGQNIYLSLAYPIQKDLSELSGLSLVMGLAICNAIENCCHLPTPTYVKWPNDIIINNKKLGGILIEIQAEAHGLCSLIIGIGLNVNMLQANKKQIPQEWTSLQQAGTTQQDRNKLCASIIDQMLSYLDRFNKLGFADFKQEWKKRDGLYKKPTSLKSNNQTIKGLGAGINEQGHLLLKMPNNTTMAFASGDASIQK